MQEEVASTWASAGLIQLKTREKPTILFETMQLSRQLMCWARRRAPRAPLQF